MDTNSYMQTVVIDEIALLASVGLEAELVFEGPDAHCPQCAAPFSGKAALDKAAFRKAA